MFSCRKQEIVLQEPLSIAFSADTISFDTIFTARGSTTRRLKIYNKSRREITIDAIRLAGGKSSPFQINVNGSPNTDAGALTLAAGDSASIFIRATVNPTGATTPFLIEDSLIFQTLLDKKVIPVLAYGQNARFVRGEIHGEWDSSLPYVITETVTVPKLAKLTLAAGAKLHFHKGSRLVVNGTLEILGTADNPVVLMSDRLEPIYHDEPGQWDGIYLTRTSSQNKINHAVIKNALIGIQADSSADSGPQLLLSNTIIKNMEVVGLTANSANLRLFNNLFYNCGQHLFYANGGNYDLRQNTFFGTTDGASRQSPGVFFAAPSRVELTIALNNNIIWGELKDELYIEPQRSTLQCSTNLIKTSDLALAINGNVLNRDPEFNNPKMHDFTVKSSSPAIRKGKEPEPGNPISQFLSKDIRGRDRFYPSTIGSYEFF